MPKYRISYKYWLTIPKQYSDISLYEVNAQNFARALDAFYALETESDGDIRLLQIVSIQKKCWLGWRGL